MDGVALTVGIFFFIASMLLAGAVAFKIMPLVTEQLKLAVMDKRELTINLDADLVGVGSLRKLVTKKVEKFARGEDPKFPVSFDAQRIIQQLQASSIRAADLAVAIVREALNSDAMYGFIREKCAPPTYMVVITFGLAKVGANSAATDIRQALISMASEDKIIERAIRGTFSSIRVDELHSIDRAGQVWALIAGAFWGAVGAFLIVGYARGSFAILAIFLGGILLQLAIHNELVSSKGQEALDTAEKTARNNYLDRLVEAFKNELNGIWYLVAYMVHGVYKFKVSLSACSLLPCC
eukprot:Hpha_TRINITY_DN6447_c0_g1::TRINITY_DN6447_c0_g1_i1::g.198::m.198